MKKARDELGGDGDELAEWIKSVRQFVADKLAQGQVALATKGPDLDEQREPLDTVVIHHTSAAPGYDLNYLNAVHLLNIYTPYFCNPTDEREKDLKGQPIWSGHFWRERQVFWGYHWLMRMDGSFEHLLSDHQIGWHSGNWEINKRSVGICLDNDYNHQDPDAETLAKLGQFISSHYRGVKPERVFGHCEIKAGTTCPGTNFVTGWKPRLLGLILKMK